MSLFWYIKFFIKAEIVIHLYLALYHFLGYDRTEFVSNPANVRTERFLERVDHGQNKRFLPDHVS